MPTNAQLRRALTPLIGQPLTADLAEHIVGLCDDFALEQSAKPDDLVRERLLFYFNGNTAAAELIESIATIAHTWDDLIDQDKPVDKKAINTAFWLAIVGLQRNPIMVHWGHRLLPVIETGILNWLAANDLEADGRPRSLEVSHVIRCQVGDVALLVCEILRGPEFARAHAAGIRMLMQQDSLPDYLNDFKEHAHA